MDFNALRAEMPHALVKWRAQTLTKDGSKAMALAYVDARAVMIRLDEVCGPGGWQDNYTETAKGRVICTLSIKIGDEWVSKSDGAGDSDVEGEKGGISDAFKRAAVKWGIARELYALPAPWVPCESYERNGRRHWKGWTADPWDFVKRPQAVKPAASKPPAAPQPPSEHAIAKVIAAIRGTQTVHELEDGWRQTGDHYRKHPQINAAYQDHRMDLEQRAEQDAPVAAE